MVNYLLIPGGCSHPFLWEVYIAVIFLTACHFKGLASHTKKNDMPNTSYKHRRDVIVTREFCKRTRLPLYAESGSTINNISLRTEGKIVYFGMPDGETMELVEPQTLVICSVGDGEML